MAAPNSSRSHWIAGDSTPALSWAPSSSTPTAMMTTTGTGT